MEITEKEERLLLRYRKRWHFVFRISRNLLAIIGIIIFCCVSKIVVNKLQAQKVHEQKMLDIQNNPNNATSYVDVIEATKWATPKEAIDALSVVYTAFVDSLELPNSIVGFVINIEVIPTGQAGWRICKNTLDILLACDCKNQNEYYDLYSLQINPMSLTASVISSQENVTLAEFESLKRHASGLRR